MKHFVTIAIALIFLLACGLQIFAEDSIQYAVCQHEVVHLGHPYTKTYDIDEYYTAYYEVTPELVQPVEQI